MNQTNDRLEEIRATRDLAVATAAKVEVIGGIVDSLGLTGENIGREITVVKTTQGEILRRINKLESDEIRVRDLEKGAAVSSTRLALIIGLAAFLGSSVVALIVAWFSRS